MKQEYINPFIESSINVITEITGLKPRLGKAYIKNVPYATTQLVVLIGLAGEIRGNVIISFNNKLACQIASIMICEDISELDEISKSAISELSNVIVGNAISIFSLNNIDIDITPPTVLTGDNMKLSPNQSTTICLPLQFEDGEMIEIDISFKE